jgi:hypothetical protein
MDAGLQTALQIVHHIVQKVQQARQASYELKQLMQHVQALQPLLLELLQHESSRLAETAAPVLDLLLNGLIEAQWCVDKVTPMSGVDWFVRSGSISTGLAGVRQGLHDALLALQTMAVQISTGTSACVAQLLARLVAGGAAAGRAGARADDEPAPQKANSNCN